MIQKITVEHVTFVSDRPYDAVVRAFHEQVGALEEKGSAAIMEAAHDPVDFEKRVNQVLGPSGFTRFLTVDHGYWVSLQLRPTKFVMYTLGNPLLALTMIRQHVEAGLDVPVRLAIYEDSAGKTRVVFDTPSSLMSGLQSDALHQAAIALDAKMMALGEAITGAKA